MQAVQREQGGGGENSQKNEKNESQEKEQGQEQEEWKTHDSCYVSEVVLKLFSYAEIIVQLLLIQQSLLHKLAKKKPDLADLWSLEAAFWMIVCSSWGISTVVNVLQILGVQQSNRKRIDTCVQVKTVQFLVNLGLIFYDLRARQDCEITTSIGQVEISSCFHKLELLPLILLVSNLPSLLAGFVFLQVNCGQSHSVVAPGQRDGAEKKGQEKEQKEGQNQSQGQSQDQHEKVEVWTGPVLRILSYLKISLAVLAGSLSFLGVSPFPYFWLFNDQFVWNLRVFYACFFVMELALAAWQLKIFEENESSVKEKRIVRRLRICLGFLLTSFIYTVLFLVFCMSYAKTNQVFYHRVLKGGPNASSLAFMPLAPVISLNIPIFLLTLCYYARLTQSNSKSENSADSADSKSNGTSGSNSNGVKNPSSPSSNGAKANPPSSSAAKTSTNEPATAKASEKAQ